MNRGTFFACFGLLLAGASARAQHLIWRPKDDQGSYRCIYGEIDVLASAPTTYFCGCNWWPSAPAGGYTGIQEIEPGRHAMIFSIWDTSRDLRSVPLRAGDPRARLSRFGGEGEGAKSMLDYHWQVGKTYRFFVVKRQSSAEEVTLATTYFFDEGLGRWVNEATIASPNGDKSVKGFGGMLNAFLENFSGRDKDVPRLATYNLWVGTSAEDLARVTEASGDGNWGTLNDAFYLASGDEGSVEALLITNRVAGSQPKRGNKDRLRVSERKLSPETLRDLSDLFKQD